MSPTVWLSLLTATIVISLTPGAGAINTMSNAIAHGWRRSVWGVIGQQLALIVHVLIVAAGVGLLIARSPLLFDIIRYTGAAYLAFLGLRMILAKVPEPAADDGTTPAPARRRAMVRRGFWVNLLNPKAIVFFLAFVPQFIRLDQPALAQYLTLIATVVIVDVIVMWGFFATAARPFRRLTGSRRGVRTLNVIFGVLFLFVAVLLLFVH